MRTYLDLVADDLSLPISEQAHCAALNAAKRVFAVESVSPLLAYAEWRARGARRPFNAKLASLHDSAEEASRVALATYGAPVPPGIHLIVRSR